MISKQIAPAAIIALKEALTNVYWYKADLQSFLSNTLSDPMILSRLNWEDYKRNIVSKLLDFLSGNQAEFQADLLRLMTEVTRIDDFSHLARLDNGEEKAEKARESVEALRKLTAAHEALYNDEKEKEERRQAAHEALLKKTAIQESLNELTKEYSQLLLGAENPQKRGYRLEKILRNLFEIFDLDPKASFRTTGEQIDGAFTFDGTDYLLEAKWQKEPVSAADLDSLGGKLARKLDNTLGLFISINGFSEDGVKAHSSGRRLTILMDGSDLMAVLEERIDLVQLLLRKRQHASQTGSIYLRIHEILQCGKLL